MLNSVQPAERQIKLLGDEADVKGNIMTQYTKKYYAPILGDETAERLEKLATLKLHDRLNDEVDVTALATDVVNGEYVGDFKEFLVVKERKYSQETLDKRYEKALAKLNEKYGRS